MCTHTHAHTHTHTAEQFVAQQTITTLKREEELRTQQQLRMMEELVQILKSTLEYIVNYINVLGHGLLRMRSTHG